MQELRSIRPLAKESLRGITPARLLGKMPKIEWVDPRSLYVEENYQRSMGSSNSTALVRKIVAGFNWSRFKPPICVRLPESGNALVIVDGQHSATAAASHPGIGKIPVLVVDAGEVALRAEAFVGHNRDRLGLTQGAIYKAELAAGSEVARVMDRACRAAGAEILTRSVSLKSKLPAGQTIAVGTIRTLARSQGEEALTRVLRILVKAGRGPMRADEIAATALAIEGTGAEIDDRLVAVIAKHSADRWHATAASTSADTNMALPVVLATLWREELNLSRPSRTLKGGARGAARVLKNAKPAAVEKQKAEPKPAAAAQIIVAPIARAIPAVPPAPINIVERGGVKLDLDRRRVMHLGSSIDLKEDETGALAILVKVMPSVLPYDRIAAKAFGTQLNSTYRIRSLVDQLQPRLLSIGLKLREVAKLGFALGAAA